TTVNNELTVRTQELSESNTLLENVQNSVNAAIVVVDQSLNILRHNRLATDFFEFNEGHGPMPLTGAKTRLGISGLIEKAQKARDRGERITEELIQGGRNLLMAYRPVVGPRGNTHGVVITILDVSPLAEAERLVRQNERLFRGAFEHAGHGMALVTREGRLSDVNMALANMLGYSRAQLRDMDFQAITVAEDLRVDVEQWSRLVSGEIDSYQIEKRYLHRDGRVIWGLLTASAIRDDLGAFVTGVKQVVDITPTKQVHDELLDAKRDAERANAAKSDLLSRASHELRTPLNAIIGFSEMIQTQTFGPVGDAHYEDYVGEILGAGRHLLSIVDDFLDLSKLEQGRFEIRDEIASPAALLTEILRLCRVQADKKQIQLLLANDTEHASLLVDRRAFRQIFLNLIGNAIAYSPEGTTVTLGLRASSVNGWGLETYVADQGPGMSEMEIAQAQEPFVRGTEAEKAGIKGTGLGLPITQHLVNLHGAELHLESKRGVGTTARIFWPADRLHDDRNPRGSSGVASGLPL
ncbi:MAG: PAS domain-containing sensor histidine kinase, partial [Rhodospirillales bacterium]